MADTPWWLYMIECTGGGIYVGIAKDVEARCRKHEEGKGALYTKLHRPVRLLATEKYPSRKEAAQAEWAMKRMTILEKWKWAYALSGGKILIG